MSAQRSREDVSGLPNTYGRSLLYVLALAIVSLLSTGSGLFNYKEATEFASRDIFYRAWSVAYPRDRSPRTAVVLLNDHSLGAKGVWPPPYETHAALLRAMLPLQPSAVMIDIGFIDERKDDTIKNFVDVLATYKKRGIPVYLAAASGGSGATRPIRTDLAALASSGTIDLVSIEMGNEIGRMNAYPLKPNDRGALPAARAIYQFRCRGEQSCVDLARDADFELWWAAKPHPLSCAQLDPAVGSCADISPTPVVRFAKLAQKWFAGSVTSLSSSELDPIPVPYSPTVNWDTVVSGQVSEEMKEHLRSSTVFYGLDLALIRDEVFSPVYGVGENRELPGVYYHAMAFDNLVALGDQRIRTSPPFGLSSTQHTAALILICCLFCLVSRVLCVAIGRPGMATYMDWIIFAIVAVAIAGVEFNWLHVTPANWLGAVFSLAPMKLADATGLTNKIFDVFAGLSRLTRKMNHKSD